MPQNTPRSLMLLHNFRPHGGGTELQAERLALKLQKKDIPITVVTPRQDEQSPLEETIGNLTIKRVPFFFPVGVLTHFAPLLWWLLRHRREFDIIHSQMAYGHSAVAVVISKILGKKSIIKLAGAGPSGDLYNFSRLPMGKIGLKVLRHADAFIAVSTQIEQELLQHGLPPEKIIRIPNGVDLDEFRRPDPPLETDTIQFVLLGQLYPVKGIDTVLQAVQRLHEQGYYAKFRVSFYGRTNPNYDYVSMAKDLGVSQSVAFHPFTTDIKKVYSQSHAYLLASRSEGLSNSLLESMAMKCAVISTKVSGSKQVCGSGNCAILIDPEAPEQLAEAMTQLIDYPEQISALGKNARDRIANKFSLDHVADQYHRLYRLLME